MKCLKVQLTVMVEKSELEIQGPKLH